MKEFTNKIFKAIMQLLKDKLVKVALKKIIGTSIAGGFKGFIIKWVAVELFDEIALPFFLFLKRNGFLAVEKINGEIKIKKIERSKVENNEKDYLNSISSI